MTPFDPLERESKVKIQARSSLSHMTRRKEVLIHPITHAHRQTHPGATLQPRKKLETGKWISRKVQTHLSIFGVLYETPPFRLRNLGHDFVREFLNTAHSARNTKRENVAGSRAQSKHRAGDSARLHLVIVTHAYSAESTLLKRHET